MLVEKIDDPSVHQLSIKDLDRHSRYHFVLQGRTAAGDGLPITKVGATTLDGGAVFSLSLSDSTRNWAWPTAPQCKASLLKITPFSQHCIKSYHTDLLPEI